MPSIDREIDAAVVRRKARAAQFDDKMLSMDEWVARDGRDECLFELISRAIRNLQDANWAYLCRLSDSAEDLREVVDHLCDAGNLSDLSLSLLPKEGE